MSRRCISITTTRENTGPSASSWDTSPTQPTRRGGAGKEIAEFDGALRANAVALSIASHFFDGASYAGPWNAEHIEARLFRKNGGTVGFLWVAEGSITIPAAPDTAFSDIMGNALPAQPCAPDRAPIYLVSSLSPEDLRKSLAACRALADRYRSKQLIFYPSVASRSEAEAIVREFTA
jgi:hypothetical protein